ncbi:hypothetical protein SUGI_0923450 [Cryptomeria japonica]|uniref:uncharacterized protein LOC131078737 n=1 Tax=Cryptomeria japonica TaxID=3369 RepID=UPI002414B62A|nr:uncharacterized protein LOC131078737 [Cryptomeria japonica]GLJ44220.1 hypothetical protein SUGI_0923450 [Cryptomeria japonica]
MNSFKSRTAGEGLRFVCREKPEKELDLSDSCPNLSNAIVTELHQIFGNKSETEPQFWDKMAWVEGLIAQALAGGNGERGRLQCLNGGCVFLGAKRGFHHCGATYADFGRLMCYS